MAPSSQRRLYSLEHSTWECSYHVVFVTKYRGQVLTDKYIKQELKREIKQIAKWKGFIIRQWYIGDEHVHLYLDIPTKYSVAYTIGILKGKTSTWIKKKTKKIPKGTLWSRGYFVSTVGANEYQIRNYIKNQEHHRYELPKLPLPVEPA
jgi:putative transposase